VISIKKLLNASREPDPAAFLRVSTLLLEGIAVHAVDCDPVERDNFQTTMRKFRRQVEENKVAGDILVSTGAAIQALENYNRGIERFIRIRGKEYEEMVGMFSKALIEISHAGQSAAQNLGRIEKDLRGASQIDDLRDLKTKLGESLKALSEETTRQQQQNQELAGRMEERLEAAKASALISPVEFDAITGLAGHTAATRDLSALIAAGESRYVAVFCVERLDLINSRFGFAAGDQILVLFTQYVAQQLGGSDKLYRWRGPGIVAVLSRRGSVADVQFELRRAASVRLEHNVTIGSRSVLLPISQSWSLLQLAGGTADDLFVKIDSFVASQASKVEMAHGR
jgi:GGDEF domain-containing protein